MTYKEAIKYMRSKRKGCVSRKSQRTIIKLFQLMLEETRKLFYKKPILTLKEVEKRQKIHIFTECKLEEKFIPNLMIKVFERLENMVKENSITAKQLF